MKTIPSFKLTQEGCEIIVTAALDKAKELKQVVSIAVVDSGGHLFAFKRMTNGRTHNTLLALAKARSAALTTALVAVLAFAIVLLVPAVHDPIIRRVDDFRHFLPLTYVVRLMRGLWFGKPWSELGIEIVETGSDLPEIEMDAWRDWDRSHPGSAWDDIKDAIRRDGTRCAAGVKLVAGFGLILCNGSAPIDSS